MNPGAVENGVTQTIGYFHRRIFYRPELRPLELLLAVIVVFVVVVFFFHFSAFISEFLF